MTLRDIKKEGYKRIIKNNEKHQSVYEELKTNKPSFNVKIADSLKTIPSKSVIEKFKALRITYIILLSIIILLRILLVYTLYITHVKTWILVIALLFGILLPFAAIYLTITHKYESLKGISILFILSVMRSIRKIEVNIETIIVFLIFIAVIIIGFLLSKYMQTNYKKTTVYNKETNKISDYKIEFESGNSIENDEILDNF